MLFSAAFRKRRGTEFAPRLALVSLVGTLACGANPPPRDAGESVPTSTPVAAVEPKPVAACPVDMDEVEGGTLTLSAGSALIAPFCIDATEVTVKAYASCVASQACDATGLAPTEPEHGDTEMPDSDDCNWGVAQREDHPINCVDWLQASTFCAAMDKRLPSANELVWAASGGRRSLEFPWGDSEPTDELCWSGIQPRSTTCPAAGWRDAGLAGNVAEWTRDPDASPGAEGSMLLKSGDWASRMARGQVGSGALVSSLRAKRSSGHGFRCVR
jgi:formylglycine-generating enzyme required for sulfatase activity